jgi:hypothetical protein
MTREDEEQQPKRGRGRPKMDGSRRNAHTVRFDDEEEAMLGHLEIESDKNKSDILRKALRTYYKIESRKW